MSSAGFARQQWIEINWRARERIRGRRIQRESSKRSFLWVRFKFGKCDNLIAYSKRWEQIITRRPLDGQRARRQQRQGNRSGAWHVPESVCDL
jgi:hypothetical protein